MIDTLETSDAPAMPAALVHLPIPRSHMQAAFPKAIHEILDALSSQGLEPAGPPFARHLRLDPERFDFEVGFPVAAPFTPEGRVVRGELPAARVVRTVYRGPYDGLPKAWQAFQDRITEQGLEVGTEFRERYLVGPESGPDASAWQTELSWVLAPGGEG